MAKMLRLVRGCKPSFPEAIEDAVVEMRVLRQQIETAETQAENPEEMPTERRRWRALRDLLQAALDVRINLPHDMARGHAKAIGAQVGRLCHAYRRADLSENELHEMAVEQLRRKKSAAVGSSNCGAI
ncbi:MAG: hypothetical protein ACUVX1_14415 [Chloroflexota bacterium]